MKCFVCVKLAYGTDRDRKEFSLVFISEIDQKKKKEEEKKANYYCVSLLQTGLHAYLFVTNFGVLRTKLRSLPALCDHFNQRDVNSSSFRQQNSGSPIVCKYNYFSHSGLCVRLPELLLLTIITNIYIVVTPKVPSKNRRPVALDTVKT